MPSPKVVNHLSDESDMFCRHLPMFLQNVDNYLQANMMSPSSQPQLTLLDFTHLRQL